MGIPCDLQGIYSEIHCKFYRGFYQARECANSTEGIGRSLSESYYSGHLVDETHLRANYYELSVSADFLISEFDLRQ